MSYTNSRSNYLKRFAKKADVFLDKISDLKKDTELKEEEFQFGEMKKKKMWEFFTLFTKWKTWLMYVMPMNLGWLFKIDFTFGLIGLILLLSFYLLVLCNYTLSQVVRNAMVDLNQPQYFNYNEFARVRKNENEFFREFDDRTIRLEDIAKEMEDFEKKLAEKEAKISELEQKANTIEPEVKQTMEHLIEIINKLNELLPKEELTLNDLNIVGEYGIYRFDEKGQQLKRIGKDKNATQKIDSTVDIQMKKNKHLPVVKIINSNLIYQRDKNNLAFLFEFEDEKPIIYNLYLDDKTRRIFDQNRASGRLSMEYTRKILGHLLKKALKK